jgi:hypothetical protein
MGPSGAERTVLFGFAFSSLPICGSTVRRQHRDETAPGLPPKTGCFVLELRMTSIGMQLIPLRRSNEKTCILELVLEIRNRRIGPCYDYILPAAGHRWAKRAKAKRLCLCVSQAAFLLGPLCSPSNPWLLSPCELRKSGQVTKVTR